MAQEVKEGQIDGVMSTLRYQLDPENSNTLHDSRERQERGH